jgi:hypothetical protein
VQLADAVTVALEAAKACSTTVPAASVCNATVAGLCCDEPVNAAASAETLQLLNAKGAFTTAGCVAQCTGLTCGPAAQHSTCVPGAASGVGRCTVVLDAGP